MPGKWPHNFHICAGTDPGPNNDLPSFVEMPSFILHIVLEVRITIYNKTAQATDHSNIRSIFQKNFYLNILKKQTIADHLTNFASVSGLFLLWIFGREIQMSSLAELNLFPNYLFVYFHNIIAPALIGLFGIMLVFKQNSSMKETIKVEAWKLITSIWTHRQD
jgi:hypothetical protein